MYYPLEMRLYDAQKTIQRIAQGHSSDGITRLHASSAVLDIYEGLSPCVSDHVMRHGFNFREKMSPIQHLDSERRDISEKDCSDCRYLVTVIGSLQTILKAGRPRTTLGGDNSHERALSSLLYESEDVWFFAEVVLTMKAIYDDHGRGDTKPRDFPTDADKVLATMREASNTGIPLPAEILVHLCLSSGDSVNEEEEGTT